MYLRNIEEKDFWKEIIIACQGDAAFKESDDIIIWADALVEAFRERVCPSKKN